MITNNIGGRKGWAAAVAALVRLGKAMPSDIADDLVDIVDIDAPLADGINANYVNRVPGRAEIPLSPTTSASGAGAEQLPKWSSDPVTQSGIAGLYDRFSKLMEQFSELKKSQLDVISCVTNLAKTAQKALDLDDDDEPEDDDSDEAKVEKALAGLGMRHGAVKDVLDAMRTANKAKMPPDFCKAAIRKAEDSVDLDTLTQEEHIRYMSARNALALAASGHKIDHDVLAKAARTVQNPSDSPSAFDIGTAAGRAGL